MHFDFFKQRSEGNISTGDEIAVFADKDDFMESGRYTIAKLQADDEGVLYATLVGMGPLEGHIAQIDIGLHGEPA